MWTIEQTSLGRIAVPPYVPPGFAVFATTLDFDGLLTRDAVNAIGGIVRDRFGIQATLATCNQVHGVTVQRVESGSEWRECDSCDALWSAHRQVALGIKVADCLPVTMVDPAHRVIVNVHSGWRGAVQGVTSLALETASAKSDFRAEEALAYLGPSIRRCCFEVGAEVASQFDERFVDRSRAKPHVDLIALTSAMLRARGFAEETIVDSGLCTRCDRSIFHSYRRQGMGGGRNLAIVAQ